MASSRYPHRSPGWRSQPRNNRHASNNSHRYASSPSPTPSTPAAEGWQHWPEISLRLENLPLATSAADLWDWFSPYGKIEWIDVHDPSERTSRAPVLKTVSASIKFRPPPRRPFWSAGSCTVRPADRERFPVQLSLKVYPPHVPPQVWNQSRDDPQRVYPLRIQVPIKSIDFGVSLGPGSMKIMKTLRSTRPGDLWLDFDTKSKTFRVHFPLPGRTSNWQGLNQFRFTVDVSKLKTVQHVDMAHDKSALVFTLPIPPEYALRNDNARSTISNDTKTWGPRDIWFRTTDVAENIHASQRHPVALHSEINDPEYIDIGRWTTYRLVVEQNDINVVHLMRQVRFALEDLNVTFDEDPAFGFISSGKPPVWTLLDHPPVSQASSSGALALMESAAQIIHLDFAVRYQLEVCISRGHLNEHAITKEFLQQLAEMEPVKARFRLEYLVDNDVRVQNPMTVLTSPYAQAYYALTKLPHYCALIRKAIITPTTIRFNTPNPETSNRVIRKFNLLQDRFLRVQFLEESEKSKIGFYKPQTDALFARIVRVLYQGIRIGDRHYEFLAFGNSQLKECAAYFFCPTETTSCAYIRKWMGQFDHIRIVAKYSARLGQCFSTTREIRGIQVPSVREVPDVERNKYCFSDGVGIISPFLARIIVEEMEMDVFDDPTAFQFRMGGCKGVLVVWPQAKRMEVHIRKSQEKFKAASRVLEIIRCARMASATLNRQTITILETLGVPAYVFLDLLDNQIRRFDGAMKNKTAAIELLTQFVDENQTTLIIAELLKAGFFGGDSNEPFVATILDLWRKWSLKILKEKARLYVEQSAFVLGCLDETGSLRGHYVATEGSKDRDVSKIPQIFLQISDPKIFRKTNIIKGVCIVGRNPSLHPGDIRVVEAVDVPQLRHLKDVVVFPSTGDRPVPNMLSGGDLDGDDFFVIWDKRLIPSEWNHPPMNYSGAKPKELERDVVMNDIRNFFVAYIKNDVLGNVATAHLGNADKLGLKSPQCLKLAAMHSQAVDFAKTGEPVIWDQKYAPRKWPHFMERKNTYRSTKALGRIFDRVNRQVTEFYPDWEDAFDQRILNRFVIDSEMLKAAGKIKSQYDTSVRRMLAQHNVNTEFELWSSFAMTRPVGTTDYKRQEDLGKEYDILKQRYRDMCYEAAGGQRPDQIDPFVAAMYKATEAEIKLALYEHEQDFLNSESQATPRRIEISSMPLVTFPWIFHWVMIRIAQGGKPSGKNNMLAPSKRRNQTSIYDHPQQQAQTKPETLGDRTKMVDIPKPSEALNIAAGESRSPESTPTKTLKQPTTRLLSDDHPDFSVTGDGNRNATHAPVLDKDHDSAEQSPGAGDRPQIPDSCPAPGADVISPIACEPGPNADKPSSSSGEVCESARSSLRVSSDRAEDHRARLRMDSSQGSTYMSQHAGNSIGNHEDLEDGLPAAPSTASEERQETCFMDDLLNLGN